MAGGTVSSRMLSPGHRTSVNYPDVKHGGTMPLIQGSIWPLYASMANPAS
jgi:hypothetical protein